MAGTTPIQARDTLAQRIRDILARQTHERDVREVRMFGGLSFMVGGRMAVAAGRDGELLVRTDPAQYDELLERGGESAYMGKDRPMGPGWLTVPGSRLEDDEDLAWWVAVGIASETTAS